MGPGETLSIAALALMVIVVVGIVAGTNRRRLALRQREMEISLELARLNHEAALATGRNSALTDTLEQRVRVLERIATDRGQDLAREIEALGKPDPILN